MAVSNVSSPLQAILRQLEPVAPVAETAAETRPRTATPTDDQTSAKADPRVNLPKDATSLDPHAPRGTYLNLVV